MRPTSHSTPTRATTGHAHVLMTITGAIGLAAAFQLTVDKFTLLQNKIDGVDTALSCDFSAFVSCGGVMDSAQAEAFGFPNSIIGIIGFTVVMALGVMLWTGAPVARWVWTGLQLGCLFGIGFVTWLQFQSIYRARPAVSLLHGRMGGDDPAVRLGHGVQPAGLGATQRGDPVRVQLVGADRRALVRRRRERDLVPLRRPALGLERPHSSSERTFAATLGRCHTWVVRYWPVERSGSAPSRAWSLDAMLTRWTCACCSCWPAY